MSETNSDKPFRTLGSRLKNIREKRRESLAEVSGAVEIDPEILDTYEEGLERPSEDILMLLISHFATKDDVATKLWELAGYDQDELPVQNIVNDVRGQAQNGVVVMPSDARIAYTDMLHVMVNNYGVVMNFMQSTGGGNQPMLISRVGMSREQAKDIVKTLTNQLETKKINSPPKALPHPKLRKNK